MVRASSGLIVLLLACGGNEGRTLNASSLHKNKDVTEGADAAPAPKSVSPSVAPPSAAIGCGQPCESAGVDAVGRCAEGVAIRCEADTVVCEDCDATDQACAADSGPAACHREGAGEEVCSSGECFTRACLPNARWCDRGVLSRCDETGQFVESTPCQLGLDCIAAQCLPAQPFVLVLFDTSDSMNWTPTDDFADPADTTYPACDDAAAPKTRVGLSKAAFRKLFVDPHYDSVAFALMRFPQRLDPSSVPRCMAGAYLPDNTVTDHAGVYTAGPWFGQNLDEVLVVPFPSGEPKGNRKRLDEWLDFDEVIRVTDTVCHAHADCPGGLCTRPNGEGQCRYFDNPELRAALGATPLGTTLFYAGEYYRQFVVREGQACAIDRDCLTVGQFCVEGKCHDPNRFCRQRSVVVFTDGFDTASIQPFYQPVVQARRLRGGLDCASNSDCNRAYHCAESGTCEPDAGGCGVSASCVPDISTFPAAIPYAATRLLDANGDPIAITVHVVDVSGPFGGFGSANQAMASYGGGLTVKPELADPSTLYEGIRGVFDWKEADFCDDD